MKGVFMYFLADFASFKSNIDIKGIKRNSTIVLNCEGYLVEGEKGFQDTVFNNIQLYKSLSKKFNIILNLANNHTMDIPSGVSQSLFLADKYKISTVGGGLNLDQASEPYRFSENSEKISVVSAGWDIIGCKPAKKNSEGVSPLEEKCLLNHVKKEKELGHKVVVYLHWDYELEIYPMPTHRELAKKLIDNGADIILGCHSHCLQGFEKYKNKYIFYGLGNSAFDEEYYFNGKLKFPDFCKVGLAVKWETKTDEVLVSKTHYRDDSLFFGDFIKPESDDDLIKLSSFSNLSHLEYIGFFKENRRKKNLLPIFYESDTTLSYQLKKTFLNIRAFIIKNMFLLGLKGHSR